MSYNWQGNCNRSPSPISVWDSLAQSQSTSRFSDSSENLGNLVSYPARQKFNTNPFVEVGWNRNEDVQRPVWDKGVWDSNWNEGRNYNYEQDIQDKNEEFYRKYYNDDTGWKRFEDRRSGWGYENFGNRKGGRSDWEGKGGFQGNKRFNERGGGSTRGGRAGSFSSRTNNQYWGRKRSSYMDMELNRDILGDERYSDKEFQTDSIVDDKTKKGRPKIQNDEGHGKRKREDSGEEKNNPSPKKNTEEVENKNKSKDDHLFKIPASLNKEKPIKNEPEQTESKTGESDNKEKISKGSTVHNASQKVEEKLGESPKGKTLSTSLSDSRGNLSEGSEKSSKTEEEGKNNQNSSIKPPSKKIEIEGNKMVGEIKPGVEIGEKTEDYKQEKKVGKEYCKLVKVYYCRLCKVHLPKIKSAKGVTAHCLTRDHLQKLMWELRTLNWPRPQGHNPQETNKTDSNINKGLDVDDNEELWSAIDQSFEDMLNDVST